MLFRSWCKHLASELSVPVILLSQPDKASSTPTGGVWPRLSPTSGKGAQSIHADANLMLLPRRPYKDLQDDDRQRRAEIWVAKGRGVGEAMIGDLKKGDVLFHGGRMRFEDKGLSDIRPEHYAHGRGYA